MNTRWTARPCQQQAQAVILVGAHTVTLLWQIDAADLEDGHALSIAIVVSQVLHGAHQQRTPHHPAFDRKRIDDCDERNALLCSTGRLVVEPVVIFRSRQGRADGFLKSTAYPDTAKFLFGLQGEIAALRRE